MLSRDSWDTERKINLCALFISSLQIYSLDFHMKFYKQDSAYFGSFVSAIALHMEFVIINKKFAETVLT